MRVKKRRYLVTLIGGLFILFNTEVMLASADVTPYEVEMSVIQEYTIPNEKIHTIQATPLSTINILNFIEKSNKRNVTDLLKTIYPDYSSSELQNVTANLDQCMNYSKNLGYNIKKIDRPLDYPTLKNEIINNRPVLAYLTANGNYWIEQESAVIIFAVQRVKQEGDFERITYFYRSLNHGDNVMISGQLNNIPFLAIENMLDPSAIVTFKWSATLYGFEK